MIKYLLRVLLLSASLPLSAQQNYFNVPSSELTPAAKPFVQQQFEIDGRQIRSMTTVTYGIGRSWEAGINLNNLSYLVQQHQFLKNDTSVQLPYAPLLLVNLQKGIPLTKKIHFSAGGQAGTNITDIQKGHITAWGYANVAGRFNNDHIKGVIGCYTGNHPYLAQGPVSGLHLGIDAAIRYQKLHLLGDWASGTNAYGQLALGVEFYLTSHFPVAFGWHRANQDGNQAFLIQLSYTPD